MLPVFFIRNYTLFKNRDIKKELKEALTEKIRIQKIFDSENTTCIQTSIQYKKFLFFNCIIFVVPQTNLNPQAFVCIPGRQHVQPQLQPFGKMLRIKLWINSKKFSALADDFFLHQ